MSSNPAIVISQQKRQFMNNCQDELGKIAGGIRNVIGLSVTGEDRGYIVGGPDEFTPEEMDALLPGRDYEMLRATFFSVIAMNNFARNIDANKGFHLAAIEKFTR